MPARSNRGLLNLLACFAVGVCTPWLAWWAFAAPNWADAADAMVRALRGGDPSAVAHFVHEEELAALSITTPEAVEIIRLVVQPALKHTTILVSPRPAMESASSITVFASAVSEGRMVPVNVVVYDLPQGPRLFLGHLCVYALRATEVRRMPGWESEWNRIVSDLEARGVKGVYNLETGVLQPFPRK